MYISRFYNQINFFITLINGDDFDYCGGDFDKCGGDLTCIQMNDKKYYWKTAKSGIKHQTINHEDEWYVCHSI